MLLEERATVQLQKRCDMIKIVIHHDLNNEEIITEMFAPAI